MEHIVPGYCDLRVVVNCDRCGLILYSEVRQVYQTKGGRWEKSITVLKDDIDSHRDCQIEKL